MSSVFRVEPAAGVLRGHEEGTINWLFAPDEERQYLVKVPVLISAVDVSDMAPASAHEVSRQLLAISGVGSTGQIVAEPQLVDFGTILVGEDHRRHVTLINSSAVDLHYVLHFEPLAPVEATTSETLSALLSCDKLSGNVPARNTVDVQLIIKPDKRARLSFAILCALQPGESSGFDNGAETGNEDKSLGPPFKLCEVIAEADFPLLQIVDARLAGMEQARHMTSTLHLARPPPSAQPRQLNSCC